MTPRAARASRRRIGLLVGTRKGAFFFHPHIYSIETASPR